MRFAAEARELGVPFLEESDRASEVSVGLVVEADGHLNEPLEERLEVAVYLSPAVLEELVDLEEEPRVEERGRGAERPAHPPVARRGWAALAPARRQRLGEPRRPPTQRLEIGGEVAAQAKALPGPLEQPGVLQDAALVCGKPQRDAALRRLQRESGERVNRCTGCWIGERCQASFGETIAQNELHPSRPAVHLARGRKGMVAVGISAGSNPLADEQVIRCRGWEGDSCSRSVLLKST